MGKTYEQLFAERNINSALGNAGKLGLLMFGLGAGARGLQGLVNLGRRNMQPRSEPSFGTHTVDIPIHDEERDRESAYKFANSQPPWYDVPGHMNKAFKGQGSTPESWPLAWPAALLAGGAGLYGGYKLTDFLLDKRRQAELDDELEQAKTRYEAALSGKTALAQDLDRLYDHYEHQKEAGATENWGRLMGGALTIGIPTALVSGLLTYDLAKKRDPATILRKAKQKRLREMAQKQPPAIYARPQYQNQTATTGVPDEDEMAGEPLDKMSSDKWEGRLKKLYERRPDLLGIKESFDAHTQTT